MYLGEFSPTGHHQTSNQTANCLSDDALWAKIHLNTSFSTFKLSIFEEKVIHFELLKPLLCGIE